MSEDEIEQWLYARMEVLGDRNHKGDIPCVCPQCGDAGNHFSVNVSKGMFNCWKCSFKGLKLDRLFDLFGQPTLEYVLERKAISSTKKSVQAFNLGYFYSTCQTMDQLSFSVKFRIEQFCAKKHCSLDILMQKGVRYNPTKFWMHDSLIFPTRYVPGGAIEFMQARSIPPVEWKFSQWRNPKLSEDVEQHLHVWGVDHIDSAYCHVVLTESIFDAFRFVNGICLFGKNINHDKFKKIITSKPTAIFICLDGDEPGREAQEKVAIFLSKYYTGSVFLPEAYEGDPDELDNETLMKSFHNSKIYNPNSW